MRSHPIPEIESALGALDADSVWSITESAMGKIKSLIRSNLIT